jgi:hypothetical protein
MEGDHKAFLLMLRGDAAGLILTDIAPIIIRKAEVTSEVQSNPSLSLSDVQSMINSVLERQARSIDELMCSVIEE